MFKSSRFWLASIAVATASLSSLAAPIDNSKSQVKFVFSQMNVAVEGAFKKFSGDITLDPAKPEAGSVNIAFDLAAADAGSADANEALKSVDWFNLAKFPKATFSASHFKPLAGGKLQATGQLSLKGRVASLTIPFTVKPDTGGLWVEGAVPLSRLAWKVGENEWSDVSAVADAVQIKFKLYVAK